MNQQHQWPLDRSYQSDKGPQNKSQKDDQNTNAINQSDIVGCMKLLEQELELEEYETISRQSRMDQWSTIPKSKDHSKNNSTERKNNLDALEEQDDEQVMSQLFGLYRQMKSSQYTESQQQQQDKTDYNTQQQDENFYSEEINAALKQINVPLSQKEVDKNPKEKEEREQKFQNFLERNSDFISKKEEKLNMQRTQKLLESQAYLRKENYMSKKSREIIERDQQNTSIIQRTKEFKNKKDFQIQQREQQLRIEQMNNCTFKPQLNPNSLSLFEGVRPFDQFYEDMLASKNKNKMTEIASLLIEEQSVDNLEQNYSYEEQSKIKMNSISQKIFEVKQQKLGNPDFIDRLDSDMDKRATNKVLLEMAYQPSFQPMIYENIRSPGIISKMQEQLFKYKLNKIYNNNNNTTNDNANILSPRITNKQLDKVDKVKPKPISKIPNNKYESQQQSQSQQQYEGNGNLEVIHENVTPTYKKESPQQKQQSNTPSNNKEKQNNPQQIDTIDNITHFVQEFPTSSIDQQKLQQEKQVPTTTSTTANKIGQSKQQLPISLNNSNVNSINTSNIQETQPSSKVKKSNPKKEARFSTLPIENVQQTSSQNEGVNQENDTKITPKIITSPRKNKTSPKISATTNLSKENKIKQASNLPEEGNSYKQYLQDHISQLKRGLQCSQ